MENDHIVNNGHSLVNMSVRRGELRLVTNLVEELEFSQEQQEGVGVLSGGNLSGEYRPTQLHFHWGSEHTIMGRRFPLEMHIVHRKVVEKRESFAVTAFLFDLSVCIFDVSFYTSCNSVCLCRKMTIPSWSLSLKNSG